MSRGSRLKTNERLQLGAHGPNETILGILYVKVSVFLWEILPLISVSFVDVPDPKDKPLR